jgi:zinc D-Ala-D-Ala carboxypeptidase
MQLTANFTLEEMTRSETAARLGLDNAPHPEAITNLTNLCAKVLEPLRAALGPIRVSSGFRSVAVNISIGGSKNSQHTTGKAADFTIKGHSIEHIVDTIRQSDLPFDQVIDEFGAWVHVSYDDSRTRRKALRARRVDGRVVYTPIK